MGALSSAQRPRASVARRASADRENVGLGVDALHVLALIDAAEAWVQRAGAGRPDIPRPAGRLPVGSLNDIPSETSRHHRVFPSEGNHGAIIAGLVSAALASIGYNSGTSCSM